MCQTLGVLKSDDFFLIANRVLPPVLLTVTTSNWNDGVRSDRITEC
jgi:hypothetical protein